MLIDALLEGVQVHEVHLEVVARGAPRLNVTIDEVGLTEKGDERSCRRNESDPTSTPTLHAILDLA